MNYVFADFELDSDRAELRRDGEPVRVEPQVFDLLKLLVSARDRVVTRDEIFEVIWGDRIVSDAALSSRVRDARKALGDDGTTQRFIRTVQRRGLRFVSEAREVPVRVPAAGPAAQPAMPPGARAASAPAATQDPFDRPAVAVLPFADLSDDRAPGHVAGALSGELSAALAAWRFFPVIAQNSAARFGGSAQAAVEIGAALQARYLVSGTFRRIGNRIKVQVGLTDAEADCQIWSERFTRDLGDLTDMEEEIAAQIAVVVMPELEGAESRRGLGSATDDMTAWELAMRAAWLINRHAHTDYAEAERLAERAAERAPNWVLPYSLIAVARFQQAMAGFSAADSAEAFSPTLDAARQALEIDRSAWIAHALAAVGELWTNRNHERALLHVERAIELNPSAGMNYHFGGCINGFAGETARARHYQERLFRVDPVYPYRAVIEADLGLWHMLDGEFEAADARLDRSLSWDPAYGRALQRRIALCGLTGDRASAHTAARRLSALGLPLDFETISMSYPFRRAEHDEMFLDGLRRSGVNI